MQSSGTQGIRRNFQVALGLLCIGDPDQRDPDCLKDEMETADPLLNRKELLEIVEKTSDKPSLPGKLTHEAHLAFPQYIKRSPISGSIS